MGVEAAARALLPASLAVCAAGIVAAGAAGVDEAVAVTAPETVIVTPAFTSAAVPIELVVTTTTTAAPPLPTTTTATTTAATVPPPPTATTVPLPATVPTVTTPPPPPPPPPTTAAPAPAPPAGDVDLACERELFDRTNATRAAHGLPALAFDGRPHAVARDWSRTMAAQDRLDHNPRYGAQLDAQGVAWRTIGENVGRGDVARIFELWMGSSTHRRNIVEPAFTHLAVACITDGGGVYVTQDFYG